MPPAHFRHTTGPPDRGPRLIWRTREEFEPLTSAFGALRSIPRPQRGGAVAAPVGFGYSKTSAPVAQLDRALPSEGSRFGSWKCRESSELRASVMLEIDRKSTAALKGHIALVCPTNPRAERPEAHRFN